MNPKDGSTSGADGIDRLAARDPMAAAIGAIDTALKLAPAISEPEVADAFLHATERALVAIGRLVPAAPDALIIPPGDGRIPGPATTARSFGESLGVVCAPTEGAKALIAEAKTAVALGGAVEVVHPLAVARTLIRVACVDARHVPTAVADAAQRAWEAIAVAARAPSRGADWEPR